MADDLRELIRRLEERMFKLDAMHGDPKYDGPVCVFVDDLEKLLDVARATLAYNERCVAECNSVQERWQIIEDSKLIEVSPCKIAAREDSRCDVCPRRQMVAVQQSQTGE